MKKSQSQPKSSKRLDLQGIRALAIIVVLGFHYYPQFVPNGYLGVDQFFVLSGFLMCMLLKRADKESPCSLVSLFYSKRFKRILPLYLLVIFLSMLALYNYFPDTAIETNKESASHALLFVSNRPKTVQEDYFAMLAIAVDIFTHTWSLSVEIQFYFLVPFMFIFGQKLSEKYQYSYYGVLGALSFVFFVSSSPSVAFNSVFARIWQFVIGMVVYIATASKRQTQFQYKALSGDVEGGEDCEKLLDEEDILETNEETSGTALDQVYRLAHPLAYVLLTILVLVSSFPIALPAIIVRPLITVGTGFLMLISEDNEVLSNKMLTYMGDISYSLYLIHWPIYAYWKLTAGGNQLELVGALLASVLLAIITFETFEKWYLKLSSTSIGALVVILFVLNVLSVHEEKFSRHASTASRSVERIGNLRVRRVVIINKDEIQDQIETFGKNITSLDGVTDNMTLDDAAKLNYRWSLNDYRNLFTSTCVYESVKSPYGWCRHKGLSPNGKFKFATIGNSWTANHAKLFYQECSHKAKSILQGAAFGCEPLYPSMHSKLCTENFTDFAEHIKKEKPDYAFIFTRFISIGDKFPENLTDIKQDPIYQVMLNQTLNFIKDIKYKLYILDSIPGLRTGYIGKISPMLKNETDPEEIDKLLISFDFYENARKRHAQLMKDCGKKCEMIDYAPEFWNNATQTFRYFDERGFSYFTTASHMSPHGFEHVRHLWRDICHKL